MCGIVGYIGKRSIIDTLLNGLQRLEYRGYDSAGIAMLDKGKIDVTKEAGKVKVLRETAQEKWPDFEKCTATLGIAHTRWATHGLPTQANAHPHSDNSEDFALVHNGIIENYITLKKQLISKGHTFSSDTDTEVIVNLISEFYKGDFLKAVAAALKQLQGTFGIAVISKHHPDSLIVARRGSPIVIGLGKDEMIAASDVTALVAYTRRVIYLNDNDIALIKADDVSIFNIDTIPVTRDTAHIDWEPGAAEKNGYDHFMIKEIFEQPDAIENAIRGRLDLEHGSAMLHGLNFTPKEIVEISNILIPACGTSLHAGLIGKYFFEDLADLPAVVAQAAEFRYSNPIIQPHSLVLAISQSGETADTLAAVREAHQKGAIVAGLCNVVGSTIAREAERGVYLHAGPEIGVASTKAFTCQVAVLLMMAIKFGRAHRCSRNKGQKIAKEILKIPELIREVLEIAPNIEKIAKKHSRANNAFFIGRGYLYPVALEGALKLKEISYIHAEGYHAAELKHGPIALLEDNIPVIALVNSPETKEKMIGNIQECKARKAPIIATATVGDEEIKAHANDIIWIPQCSKFINPIVTVVALQLLSYYIAKERGCAIDQPRNLAKSVTVE